MKLLVVAAVVLAGCASETEPSAMASNASVQGRAVRSDGGMWRLEPPKLNAPLADPFMDSSELALMGESSSGGSWCQCPRDALDEHPPVVVGPPEATVAVHALRVHGLAKRVVKKVVQVNDDGFRWCYRRWLLKAHPEGLNFKVSFEIHADATVANVVLAGAAPTGELAKCIRDEVERWAFFGARKSSQHRTVSFRIALASGYKARVRELERRKRLSDSELKRLLIAYLELGRSKRADRRFVIFLKGAREAKDWLRLVAFLAVPDAAQRRWGEAILAPIRHLAAQEKGTLPFAKYIWAFLVSGGHLEDLERIFTSRIAPKPAAALGALLEDGEWDLAKRLAQHWLELSEARASLAKDLEREFLYWGQKDRNVPEE